LILGGVDAHILTRSKKTPDAKLIPRSPPTRLRVFTLISLTKRLRIVYESAVNEPLYNLGIV